MIHISKGRPKGILCSRCKDRRVLTGGDTRWAAAGAGSPRGSPCGDVQETAGGFYRLCRACRTVGWFLSVCM